MILLSIDWDWVTGDCSDPIGGHGCCGWCTPPRRTLDRGIDSQLSRRWGDRAAILMSARPIDPGGGLYVAECHADILRILKPNDMDEILHLDSHSDDEDWFPLSCGSWRIFLPRNVIVRTPDEKELGELAFHDVFMCLSSPWTPPSKDEFFWDLVNHMMDEIGEEPEFVGHRAGALERAWRQDERRRRPEIDP